MEKTALILTSLPDSSQAIELAERLIKQKLAACVHISTVGTSLYYWQGAFEQAQEVTLFIKAPAEQYTAIESVILQHHPYELPEIIMLPISRGSEDYLKWVHAESQG